MSDHTPGPWKAGTTRTSHGIPVGPSPDGSYQWTSERGRLVVATVHEEADAHLIAAAPELLEALEELLACVELTDDPQSRTNVAVRKADAAIAKARGQQVSA